MRLYIKAFSYKNVRLVKESRPEARVPLSWRVAKFLQSNVIRRPNQQADWQFFTCWCKQICFLTQSSKAESRIFAKIQNWNKKLKQKVLYRLKSNRKMKMSTTHSHDKRLLPQLNNLYKLFTYIRERFASELTSAIIVPLSFGLLTNRLKMKQ